MEYFRFWLHFTTFFQIEEKSRAILGIHIQNSIIFFYKELSTLSTDFSTSGKSSNFKEKSDNFQKNEKPEMKFSHL